VKASPVSAIDLDPFDVVNVSVFVSAPTAAGT
jgi:hypothetical protein